MKPFEFNRSVSIETTDFHSKNEKNWAKLLYFFTHFISFYFIGSIFARLFHNFFYAEYVDVADVSRY